MHYKINDCLIKSENAARGSTQTNRFILSYISELPDGITALDYGCGKCRYSKHLNEKTSELVVVDSTFQINRKQIIHGSTTTVKDFAQSALKNTTAYVLEDDTWKQRTYEFVLCTNVLSAIPDMEERYAVLRNIAQVLGENGIALISVQYRNSYFSTYNSNPAAQSFEDGWIIKRGSSFSFYGIILPDKLVEMCTQSGLAIEKNKKADGSVYLFVRRNKE